jgi:hypothetical protein
MLQLSESLGSKAGPLSDEREGMTGRKCALVAVIIGSRGLNEAYQFRAGELLPDRLDDFTKAVIAA